MQFESMLSKFSIEEKTDKILWKNIRSDEKDHQTKWQKKYLISTHPFIDSNGAAPTTTIGWISNSTFPFTNILLKNISCCMYTSRGLGSFMLFVLTWKIYVYECNVGQLSSCCTSHFSLLAFTSIHSPNRREFLSSAMMTEKSNSKEAAKNNVQHKQNTQQQQQNGNSRK